MIDRHKGVWTPTLACEEHEGVTLLGVDTPVLKPNEKRELHEQYGAHVVDCESHAFAKLASEARVPWGVCRGISDAFDESLPSECGEWINASGGVRPSRVLRSVLSNPRQIGTLRRLRQQSAIAMKAAAMQLRRQIELIEREGHS